MTNMIFNIASDNIKLIQSTVEMMKAYWGNQKTCYFQLHKSIGLVFLKPSTFKSNTQNSGWIPVKLIEEPNALFDTIMGYFKSNDYMSLLLSRPIPQYNDDSSYGYGLRIFHPNPYAEYGWNIYRYARSLSLTNEYLPYGYDIRESQKVFCEITNSIIDILPFDENPQTISKSLFQWRNEQYSLWDIDFIVEPYPCEYHK